MDYEDYLEKARRESEDFFIGLSYAAPLGCSLWLGFGLIVYAIGIFLGMW